jgi:hypothetical protein
LALANDSVATPDVGSVAAIQNVTLHLDELRADKVRSPNSDDVHVIFIVKVGDETITRSTLIKKVKRGTVHPMNLSVGPVSVSPGQNIHVEYHIVNQPPVLSIPVREFGEELVQIFLTVKDPKTVKGKLEQLGVSYVGGVFSTLLPNCKGIVAEEKMDYTLPALLREWPITKEHPGSDSPSGCGENSRYFVTRTLIMSGTIAR